MPKSAIFGGLPSPWDLGGNSVFRGDEGSFNQAGWLDICEEPRCLYVFRSLELFSVALLTITLSCHVPSTPFSDYTFCYHVTLHFFYICLNFEVNFNGFLQSLPCEAKRHLLRNQCCCRRNGCDRGRHERIQI